MGPSRGTYEPRSPTRSDSAGTTSPSWSGSGRSKESSTIPSVLILIGSESDRPKIEGAVEVLRAAGVETELLVSSAHREPDRTRELAAGAREKGYSVVICGAGLSAALPGVVAAHTDLPVIGVPISAGTLGGLDALLSTAQMPPGVPVAAVGIDNAKNAAHLALRMLRMAGRL